MPFDATSAYKSSDIRSPIEQALEWSAALPVRKAWPRLAVLWAVVALLDMASGRLVSLNALYMVPLCLTTWCFGRTLGLIAGAAAVTLTLTINGFGDGLSAQASTVPALVAAWNAGMRIAAVAFLILLVSAFRRTFDRERTNARIDPLTGLGNRRAFAVESRKLELAAARDQRILLCGLIDLDDFKLINDTNGHGVGDQVLQTVASALRSAVRPYDAVARIGGDELAFCLIVRDAVSAEQTATKIFGSIAAALRATPVAATCSLGATTSPHLDSALAQADRPMYAAKAAGKGVMRFNRDT